jgi:carboxyl-terminal processing protease
MRPDDDKTLGTSGTPPDYAAGATPGGAAGATPGGAAGESAATTGTPATPWQQGGWPSSAGSPWGAPPSASGQWGAQPPAQPAWQSGSGWSPMPASGDFATRRPSRLPQILVAIAACLIAFSGGLLTDHVAFGGTTTTCVAASPDAGATQRPAPTCAPATPNATIQGSDLYDEALAIIKEHWVGRSTLTDEELLYGSIRGMVDSLGDTGHSVFLTPEEYAAWQASLAANVAGIGVMTSAGSGTIKVERVLPGTPAEKAGVKAGDEIVKIDGVDVSSMTYQEAISKVRGEPGTSVTLTIVHAGSTTPVDITIVRANIEIPLVVSGIVPGTHIVDIFVTEFAQGVADKLHEAIVAAKSAGATSIILDLRGNPGGYALEAQLVASEFLKSGVVYMQEDAKGVRSEIKVDTSRPHTDFPLVVLVDHGSASASEIGAGALQDQGRAKIVGVNTFGTGTVLQQFPLSDGSVIILGTAWWLTPNGHRIFGVGITPDEIVQMPAGVLPIYPSDLPAMSTYGLSESGDAQLLAAVNDLEH